MDKITNENYKKVFEIKWTQEQLKNLFEQVKINIQILEEIGTLEEFEVKKVSEFFDLNIGLQKDWYDLFPEYFSINNEWKEIFFEEDFDFSELEYYILDQVLNKYNDLFIATRLYSLSIDLNIVLMAEDSAKIAKHKLLNLDLSDEYRKKIEEDINFYGFHSKELREEFEENLNKIKELINV